MNAQTYDFSAFQERIKAEQRARGLRPGAMPEAKQQDGAVHSGSSRSADNPIRQLSDARKAAILKMVAKRGMFTSEVYENMPDDLRHVNRTSLGSFLRDMANAGLLTCRMGMNGRLRMGFWRARAAK